MSAYPPPKENLPIYNPTDFEYENIPLTLNDAKEYYLEYPTAQGEETLQATIINGQLTCNDVAIINDSLDISQPTNTLNALNIENDEPGYSIRATQKTGSGGILTASTSASTGKSNVITQAGDTEIAGGINDTTGALTLVHRNGNEGQGIRIKYDANTLYGSTELANGGSATDPNANPGQLVFPDGTIQTTASTSTPAMEYPTHWVQSNGNQLLISTLSGSSGTATIQLPYCVSTPPTNPTLGCFAVSITIEIKYTITFASSQFNWLFTTFPSDLVYNGYWLGNVMLQPYTNVSSGTTSRQAVLTPITETGNMFQSQSITNSSGDLTKTITPVSIDYLNQTDFNKLEIVFGDCQPPLTGSNIVGLTSFTRSVRIVDNFAVNTTTGNNDMRTMVLPNGNVANVPVGAYFTPY